MLCMLTYVSLCDLWCDVYCDIPTSSSSLCRHDADAPDPSLTYWLKRFTRVADTDTYVLQQQTRVIGLTGTNGIQDAWVEQRLDVEKDEYVVSCVVCMCTDHD